MHKIWSSVSQLERKGGVLHFDGCSTKELAEKFGTPLYVYSEQRIRENYHRLLKAFKKHYDRYEIFYAVKANNNPAIVNIFAKENAGADCSCPSEIFIAKRQAIPKERIIYTGAYVSKDELLFAITEGVCVNLDSVESLKKIPLDNVPEILSFRVNPLTTSSGKEGLVFAGEEAKFGIMPEQIEDAYFQAREMGVKRFGVHMMVGSNILDPFFFDKPLASLLDLIGPVVTKLGVSLEFVNIGGALGIPYRPEEKELDIELVAKNVVTTFKQKCKQYSLGEPKIIQEPGRYLVGDAGILLSSVQSIKKSYHHFLGLDAGMNTLLRPALYGSYHHLAACVQSEDHKMLPFRIVGPICENTDQFHKKVVLPENIQEKDQIALFCAGAYGFSMSSQYNTRPRAAEVLVKNGTGHLIRARETFDDLIRNTFVPKH